MSNEQWKPGDWMCGACGNHNFARRASCHRCGAVKAPAGPGAPPVDGNYGGGGWGSMNVKREAGDWDCPNCGNLNFQRRTECHRCDWSRTANPNGYPAVGGEQYYNPGYSNEMEQYQPQQQGYQSQATYSAQQRGPDDWDCWICGNMNFARRTSCKLCGHDKDKCLPKKGAENAKPGDWLCMACQQVNYSYRQTCLNCNGSREVLSNELVLERLTKEGKSF
ncbi:RNA-binding protein cabeza [Diplonema papillatum]|nr:RNA-binding protein cabeza [Diplonema papillatum]